MVVGTPDGANVLSTLTFMFVVFRLLLVLLLYSALEAVDGMATVLEPAVAILAGIVALRGPIDIILSCFEMNLGVKVVVVVLLLLLGCVADEDGDDAGPVWEPCDDIDD